MMSAEVWSIDESFRTGLIESLEAVAETGHGPEALSPSNSYSQSKLQVVGDTAIIPIMGVIRPRPDFFTKYYGGTACEDFRRDFESVIGNAQIKQIILVCDSPGGSVMQIDETAKLIFESRSIKQITAVTIGQNCSACYYIASAAGRSIASPSSMIGSVGVKMTHVEYSEAYADAGIAVTDIQFGKHKTDGSPYRKLDAQGRKTLQDMVDAHGNMFIDAVSKHRGVPRATAIKDFGEGKSFLAAEAVTRNMIDAVGTIKLTQSTTPDQIIAEAVAAIAAVNPIETPTAASNSSLIQQDATGVDFKTEETQVNKKLKALMFGMDLIDAIDASDDSATAVLKAYCQGKGITLEMVDGKIDPDKAIAALKGSAPAAAAGPGVVVPPTTNPSAAQAARDQEIAEARQEALRAQEERRENIEGVATLINMTRTTPVVTRDMINEAIKGDASTDDLLAKWTKLITAGNDGGTLVPAGQITGGPASEDKFAEAAALTMLNRVRPEVLTAEERKIVRENSTVANMSALQIAAESIRFTQPNVGIQGMQREALASFAIQGMNPGVRQTFGSNLPGASAGPALNRPGDFPTIMSNLAGVFLDKVMMLSRTTFAQWSTRLPDADNFKADTYVAIGSFTNLDDLKDDEKFKQLKMSTEYKGYIKVDRKGNKVKLTPIMLMNGAQGLDTFMQQIQTLGYAHDNTLNDMAIDLLTSNPMLPDGTRLFDATRKNLIASGGPPSKEQAEKMKLAHYAQRGVGTEMRIQTRPDLALVPSNQETPAEQTYIPLGRLPESKEATLDTDLNVHRGKLAKGVVLETALDERDTQAWYTFDTMYRTVCHQFMAGYSQGGKRNTWFSNDDDCRHFSLTGIFGVSILGHRGVVKNPGQ